MTAAVGPVLLVKSGGEAAMPEWRHWFTRFAPELDVRWWEDGTVAPEAVIYAFVWEPEPRRLAALPNLRLVCSDGAGVEHIVSDSTLPPELPVVRLVTAEAAQLMAEYVCMACLALLRDLPRSLANQRLGRWQDFPARRTAREVRVGLMGLGRVADALPGALAGVGFQLAGWSATRRAAPGMECFAGDDELRAFMAASDIVVNLLPQTPATRGILRAETLGWLPGGAGMVNVGRGGHLVLPDLLAALDSGQVGGAVLDVFEPEPLPVNSPLWSHPRVIVTAHGAAYGSPEGRAAYVADIVARDRRGEALPNLFNRALGY